MLFAKSCNLSAIRYKKKSPKNIDDIKTSVN